MPFQDFTTYTEVDPGADIAVIASKITATAVRSRQDTFYVYKDMTAGFFSGDFTHRFEIEFSSAGSVCLLSFWGLANSVNDQYGVYNGSEDGIYFFVYNTTEDLTLRIIEDGVTNDDIWAAPGPQPNTTYYITITRDDDGGVNSTGQVKAYIRTGSHTGTLEDTLTVDCGVGEQNDFRYIYGLAGFDNNLNVNTVSGFTQNLDLAPFEATIEAGVGLNATVGTNWPEIIAGVGVEAVVTTEQAAAISAGLGLNAVINTEAYASIIAGIGIEAEVAALNWAQWLAIYGSRFTARYYFTLTGAPDGLADIVLPITSFQYRLRDNTPSYLQVVIPRISDAQDIADRSNGDMIVEMAYLVDGVEQQREQLARVDLENVRVDKGTKRRSTTLSGHRTETWGAQIVTLQGITYQSDYNGLIRVRTAMPDLWLRPGDTVNAGAETFVAGQVMTAMAEKTQWTEVVEAA